METAIRRRTPYIYRYHVGLTDAVIPLYYETELVGAIVTGGLVLANDKEPNYKSFLPAKRKSADRLKAHYKKIQKLK